MQEPLSVRRAEFIDCIRENVNRCNLPACMIADALKAVYDETVILANSELRRDSIQWAIYQRSQAQKEMEEKENTNELTEVDNQTSEE